VRRSSLDQCTRGKHDLGGWYTVSRVPVLDELGRFRCLTCGAWMFRTELAAVDVQYIRKIPKTKRLRWELSNAQDKEARAALLERRSKLRGDLPGADSQGPAGVDSPRSLRGDLPGADSQGPAGVDSPRSRGVNAAGRLKAVRS